MKKALYAAVGMAVIFASSCKKDSTEQTLGSNFKPLVVGATVDTLVGDITVNTTLTRTTYLNGLVHVKPGVTLTVNAGVTVKGSLGTSGVGGPEDGMKGTLVIEKGAKLTANGTATNPIVWTSEKNAGSRAIGDWGGVVLLGNAPIVTTSGAGTNVYEAFPVASIPNTGGRHDYGGSVPNDNSGSITYNRFEFGGGLVAAANREVNGLTFAGVGSGTVAHHIEVLNAGDDGFEFFGGTINVDHLLSYGNVDDDFDFDEGYQGRLQFIIGYRTQSADISGSNLIELDNNATGAVHAGKPRTLPFISNATLIGPASQTVSPTSAPGSYFNGIIHVRRSGLIRLLNSIVSSQTEENFFISTATTDAALFGDPTQADKSAVIANLFEPDATADRTRLAASESASNIIYPHNAALEAEFIADGNSFLASYASFKLDAVAKPLAGSPALSGAFNLAPYGFVSTTQRGAVRTTDVWTTQGWISIASN